MVRMAKQVGNQILDLLPADERERLVSASQHVSLPHSHVVFRDGGEMPYVFFPITGVFGIELALHEDKRLEGATVGHEGMVGLPLFLGVKLHPFKAVAHIAGTALRVPAAVLLEVAECGRHLDRLLRRYACFRMRASKQTGACNALHCAEERIARWLLMAHDRAQHDEFLMTHEFLSLLLGIRRQTVSLVAATMQDSGIISYRRGMLRVLNRQGLEAASCACYATIQELYQQIVLE